MYERGSVLKIIIVINVQWPFCHNSAPCCVNTGWTVLGHTGREGQSDQYGHRTSRGNVRTPAYLMIHEHVRRWWKPVHRGEGKGGILIIVDLIPSLITHDLAIHDLCLVASTNGSLNWGKKKGRMEKLVNLCSFCNPLGGVAFEHRLIFKDYKKSNGSSFWNIRYLWLNSLIYHTFKQHC